AAFTLLEPTKMFAASGELIRFASIGTGVRGCELLRSTLAVPGTECVAVADLYDGRQIAAQETIAKNVPVTRDYHKVQERKDVDAVIVAVMDHQHRRVVEDAFAAGKDVYFDKSFSPTGEDGFAMGGAAVKGKELLQAGVL